MGEFFFDYGLFTAKFITIIIFILLAIVIFAILFQSRDRDKEVIEIEKINDKFDTMKEALGGGNGIFNRHFLIVNYVCSFYDVHYYSTQCAIMDNQ